MEQLYRLFQKAPESVFYKWLLNKVLGYAIPFNKPHGFTITKTTEEEIEVLMPYRKSNLNHIKGLHACGLATLCEYACGLQLSKHLNPRQYRIIMPELTMSYFYQGKSSARVNFRLKKSWVEKEVVEKLKATSSIVKIFTLDVYDTQKNHLCTAKVSWQIKEWEKVRTKL